MEWKQNSLHCAQENIRISPASLSLQQLYLQQFHQNSKGLQQTPGGHGQKPLASLHVLLGPITALKEHMLVLWKLVKKAYFLRLVLTHGPNKVGMQVLIMFLRKSLQFFWEKHQHTLALSRWLWNGWIWTTLCWEAQVIHLETSQGGGLSKQWCRWGCWSTASKASHKLLILVVQCH